MKYLHLFHQRIYNNVVYFHLTRFYQILDAFIVLINCEPIVIKNLTQSRGPVKLFKTLLSLKIEDFNYKHFSDKRIITWSNKKNFKSQIYYIKYDFMVEMKLESYFKNESKVIKIISWKK